MGVQFFKSRRGRPSATRAGAVLAALVIVIAGATVTHAHASSADPVVTIDSGAVRGTVVSGTYAFRGLPYAAAPIGDRRWRPPAAPAVWRGVRDATEFAPSCPQPLSNNLFLPPGPTAEDCLNLNIATQSLRGDRNRPVLVWIHGGGWTQDAGRDYDGTKLAAGGVVVVTINYRLGALGFLSHPALASSPEGPSGNYGLMDQQAALRWVQDNIRRFGGDPHDVTIAGESAGGLSVLAHLVSPGSRGLFQRAIIQSGSFALKQQTLAQGKAFGRLFADSVGCSDQSAACLRQVPVSTLLEKFPGAAIPGIIDGAVIPESFGTALAAGRFARVPVLNGVNTDEQRVFVTLLGLTVTGGSYVPIPGGPGSITADNYEDDIAAVLGVSASRAAAVAAEYPVGAYPSPEIAFSTLDNDASWACPALEMDQALGKRVPTFAYEFNDDNAPPRYFPPLGVATHGSELSYIFDLPAAPIQAPFSPDSAALAATMRSAWASFAASGNPASGSDLRWPSFGGGGQQRVLSLRAPGSQVIRDFASRHHCGFWAGG
jgi:para-nitrobenzyl esterase